MRDWILSGEICAKARKFGSKLIIPGASHKEVTEKVEDKIIELGGNLAFPVQISVNNTAAHYNSLLDGDFKFKEGDLVKLDLGVHIKGAIADTAISIDLGNNSKLIKATEHALYAALDIIKPGITLAEIGKTIQDEITYLDLAPIKNLGGHGLALFKIHDKPSIPNYNNGDKTILKKGQVVAIEPFASNGDGLVVEGAPSEIYEIQIVKNTRHLVGRQIIKYVYSKNKTLPFSKRQLASKFNKLQLNSALVNLRREGIIYEYPVLVERRKGALVSQAEHTVIVGEQVTTKI